LLASSFTKIKEMSSTRKLLIAILVIAGILMFYGIGIATNFFAQPMFSMFFVISSETAHNVVAYLAIGAAVAIGLLGLVLVIRKRRSYSPVIQIKPVIPLVQRPVKVVSSDFKIAGNPERIKLEPKMKNSAPAQVAEVSKADPANEPKVHQIPIKPEVTKTAIPEKFKCPSCKKEFTTPMLMIDYSSPKAGLVSYCPYCYEPINQQKKL